MINTRRQEDSMTGTAAAPDLQFEAPGPGSYSLDPVHFPRPLTRYWTEVHPAELLGLMRRASPVSAGASAELDRLVAALRADTAAQELLASTADPGSVLADLRALDGETGEAMSAYLDLVGNRLLDGFDIS